MERESFGGAYTTDTNKLIPLVRIPGIFRLPLNNPLRLDQIFAAASKEEGASGVLNVTL